MDAPLTAPGMTRRWHDALLRLADEIDNRLGPIPGHLADRIAETMRRASGEYEERVGELLAVNTRAVERRREAETAAAASANDALMWREAACRAREERAAIALALQTERGRMASLAAIIDRISQGQHADKIFVAKEYSQGDLIRDLRAIAEMRAIVAGADA